MCCMAPGNGALLHWIRRQPVAGLWNMHLEAGAWQTQQCEATQDSGLFECSLPCRHPRVTKPSHAPTCAQLHPSLGNTRVPWVP